MPERPSSLTQSSHSDEGTEANEYGPTSSCWNEAEIPCARVPAYRPGPWYVPAIRNDMMVSSMPSLSVPLALTAQSVAPTWQLWMGDVMPPEPSPVTSAPIETQPGGTRVLSIR